MPRPRPHALVLLALLAWLASACAGRKAAGPRYAPAEELAQCRPDECVEARLSFRHWANADHYRGRMIYHCDPGSELDGPPDYAITRLIFAVHGSLGSKPEHFAAIEAPPGLHQIRFVNNALRRAQELDPELDADSIAIIAPTFQRTVEWQPFTDVDKRIWTWRQTRWSTSTTSEERSVAGVIRAEAVSSFDLFDEFMRAAVVKFPNLEQLVIVGHSGGGQAVHRYAMLGVGVHEHLESEGISIRYIPANPGSYAFPLMTRKLPPGQSRVRAGPGNGDTADWRWGQPSGCPDYDDWGYGLGKLTQTSGDRPERAANYAIDNYLRPVDRKLARQALRNPGSATWAKAARIALRLQYSSREVWHIQAANDRENSFPDSCRALSEGRSRFERFIHFQEAWTVHVNDASPVNLHFVALEHASHPHSSKVVYASDPGIHLLFH